MTKIETEHVQVNGNQKDIYQFLANFNNFQQLLPEDKVENWNSSEDSCSFRIKGMTDIGMIISEKKDFKEINIQSHGKVPFDFKLNIYLKNLADDKTEAYLEFLGDINPFMKMMVEKPLTNFFNMLAQNLVKLYQ